MLHISLGHLSVDLRYQSGSVCSDPFSRCCRYSALAVFPPARAEKESDPWEIRKRASTAECFGFSQVHVSLHHCKEKQTAKPDEVVSPQHSLINCHIWCKPGMQRCNACIRMWKCAFAFCQCYASMCWVSPLSALGVCLEEEGGENTRFSSGKLAWLFSACCRSHSNCSSSRQCVCVWKQEVGAQISRAGAGRWEVRLTHDHQGCKKT